MSFGYPSFLWALTVLAIPIIIHLFNFRKTTRIFFSNTRFLKLVKEETTQKRKLKQYLVLASRLLFLLFLVLAFAQPFLPAREQLTGLRSIVIYVDNSFSMATPVGEKKRALDEGIRIAQSIADLFPADTRYQLLTNDFASYSNSFKTKAEITDLLSQIRLSPVSRSASEILSHVKESHATLFWLSDFQKSTFGKPVKIDSTLKIQLVPFELESYSNVFTDSVYLENPFAIGGEKNTLKVRLRSSGKKNVQGLTVKLSINGVQAAATSTNIDPNSFTEVPFDVASGLSGNNKAIISFTDYPVGFDNDFYFTLNYSSKLKIVEVRPDNQSTFVEKVFGNRELFSFKSFTTANLNYSLLATADLVIINGLDRVDAPLAAAIIGFKKNFGALLLVPGAQPDLSSYQKISPLPLTKAAAIEMTELDKPDFKNPFFKNVFEDKTSSIAMPHATRVMDWGIDGSALLKFKSNQPFLSQFGNIFLVSSPLEKKYTDFQSHALFVPVMYRVAASGKKHEQQLYYTLNSSTITLASDSLMDEEPAKLVGSQEIIPSQRKTDGRLVMDLPKHAVSAGFYHVIDKRDTLGLVAFDLDKEESILEQLTTEETKVALGGSPSISSFKASSPEEFRSEIREKYLGKQLWKYAVLLSLLFLLSEVLLIRFLK